jgi:hypothetical protein
MFSRSTDAQFLMPTVIALAWGVFFALFVTWFFVPALYVIGVDIARFYRWAWTGEKQPELGEGKSTESDYGTVGVAGARHLDHGPGVKPAE